MSDHEIHFPNGSVIRSHSDNGPIDSTRHHHPWMFLLRPDDDREDFMRLASLLGEREDGPMRFESTPGDGPNPYHKKFFEVDQ